MLRLDRHEEAALLAGAMRQIERCGLSEHAHTPAGSLPLGQQRIVEIARARAAQPVLRLLDEPSLGLVPLIVREALQTVARLRKVGVSVLLIEQNARAALRIADRGDVLEMGAIVLHGAAEDLLHDRRIVET